MTPESPDQADTKGPERLLEVVDLHVGFRGARGMVAPAVQGVSFGIREGESLAVVGESGSGKSVTAMALTRLLREPPAVISKGHIFYRGEDVLAMDKRQLQSIRGGEIAYVFQEAFTSLNPVYQVGKQLSEALRLHRPEIPGSDRKGEGIRWLSRVGIVNAEERWRSYPHELSGGMQQRVMIAMALCCHPKLLIADEPTTALDVTIQAKILEVLAELREEIGMSLLFVTHNLGIVQRVADRVAVFFRGKLVEEGRTETILKEPSHSYTKALLGCVPRLGSDQERLATIPDELEG